MFTILKEITEMEQVLLTGPIYTKIKMVWMLHLPLLVTIPVKSLFQKWSWRENILCDFSTFRFFPDCIFLSKNWQNPDENQPKVFL